MISSFHLVTSNCTMSSVCHIAKWFLRCLRPSQTSRRRPAKAPPRASGNYVWPGHGVSAIHHQKYMYTQVTVVICGFKKFEHLIFFVRSSLGQSSHGGWNYSCQDHPTWVSAPVFWITTSCKRHRNCRQKTAIWIHVTGGLFSIIIMMLLLYLL